MPSLLGKNTLNKPRLRASAFFFSLLHLSITLKFKSKKLKLILEILKILIQNYLQEILHLITQLPKNTSGTQGGCPYPNAMYTVVVGNYARSSLLFESGFSGLVRCQFIVIITFLGANCIRPPMIHIHFPICGTMAFFLRVTFVFVS